VGPEYPTFKDFYNLGNETPYTYNMTLADQYLAKANIKNMPTFTIAIQAECEYCTAAAQVMQACLQQLNITSQIQVLEVSQHTSLYTSYQGTVQNAQQIGQIGFMGTGWGPTAVDPADNFISWVSNTSLAGNWAGYYDPAMQACVNSFFNGTSLSQLQAICRTGEIQAYNDAPYLFWRAVMVDGWFSGVVEEQSNQELLHGSGNVGSERRTYIQHGYVSVM
jgi:hypothetical protein